MPPPDFAVVGATVACMATFPPRYPKLRAVVAALAPQVDWLFIYANRTLEGFPALEDWPNVVVLDGRDHAGDLSANGKIFPLRFLRDCLVFTVDDDFIYPPDYVDRSRAVLAAFDNRCCVTVHGGIFPPVVRSYYERYRMFLAPQALPALQLVSLAGSGTFAFHQSSLALDPEDFRGPVMVDLQVSLAARRQGLPIWSLARPALWLRPLGGEGLFQDYRQRITHHTLEARRHDWSFAGYREPALAALEGLARKQAAGEAADVRIDPELAHGLRSGEIPSLWRRSRVSFNRRGRYLELLAEAADAGR